MTPGPNHHHNSHELQLPPKTAIMKKLDVEDQSRTSILVSRVEPKYPNHQSEVAGSEYLFSIFICLTVPNKISTIFVLWLSLSIHFHHRAPALAKDRLVLRLSISHIHRPLSSIEVRTWATHTFR